MIHYTVVYLAIARELHCTAVGYHQKDMESFSFLVHPRRHKHSKMTEIFDIFVKPNHDSDAPLIHGTKDKT